MKITNKYNMPQAMVHAVSHDRYEPGDGDVSCTTLIAPAQQFQLNKVHGHETEEDVIDRIWALIGSAVHYMIENAVIDMKEKGLWNDKFISEKRFYHMVGGKNVSAQIDLYENKNLSDFKITSIWAIKHALEEGKPDWDAQLNIQRYLMIKNFYEVNDLYIVAIARDWNRSGRMRDKDYPRRVVKFKIPVWSIEKTEEYILGRINALYSEHLVPCTPSERWESPTKYALMKKGGKRALRLLDSEKDALVWAANNKHAEIKPDIKTVDDKIVLKTGFLIEKRPGECKRCQDYCEVMPFCNQYADWLKENGIDAKRD